MRTEFELVYVDYGYIAKVVFYLVINMVCIRERFGKSKQFY